MNFIKSLPEIEEEGKLPNSFYKASITPIQNLTKGKNRERDIYRPISLINIDAKILNKLLSNGTHHHMKKIICKEYMGFIQRSQG